MENRPARALRALRTLAYAVPFAILLALALALAPARARAEGYGYPDSLDGGGGGGESRPQIRVFRWPKWSKGFDLGSRVMGRFSKGDNPDAPPGNVFIHAGAHIWWEHLFELHANLGLGIPNTTFEMGGGFKINLLEFLSDPTAELIQRGIQRGLLAKILQNFMFYASVDRLYYIFPTPDAGLGLSYQPNQVSLQPGLGAQWYFFIPTNFSSRWYIDTALSYTRFGPNNYLLPYLGVGFELR